MKFKIQSKTLLTRLNALSKVVNSKNAISILDNFLFSVAGDKLTITGSDQENTLTSSIEVTDVEGEGKFAINVKYILDALKGLSAQTLEFSINDSTYEINIKYQNGNYNSVGINGDEFPKPKDSEGSPVDITLEGKDIYQAISNTLFAVATEDIRPIMMGILWDIKPQEIVFVASDTHKLVRFTDKNIQTGHEASFILPSKPALILQNSFPKDETKVRVLLDSASATFISDDYTLNCRFINGKYPNYNSVIPQNNPFELTVDRLCLLNAVKRVSVSATTGGLIKFELEEDTIHLTAQDVDYSTSAEENITCGYKGDGMTIGFNFERMVEVLNNMESDNVIIKLGDPSRAGIFLPDVQEDGEELLVLLMPMMI